MIQPMQQPINAFTIGNFDVNNVKIGTAQG